MDELSLFIRITKIDAAKRLVYGIVAAEKPDAAKEICDYESTKPLYQRWSDGFVKATDGKSLGNLRTMHGNVAVGKVVELSFDDAAKRIQICGKVVDDGEWTKVEEGVYTGFSQGGKYIKRWPDPGDSMLTRYTAEPLEVSLVDNLCLPDATFSVIKADGTTELRKFKHSNPDNDHGHVVVQKSGDAPNDNEVGEQVWINSRLPGRTFKRKADLRQALIDLDAEEAAQKTAAPVLDALAGIKDRLAKTEGGGAGAGADGGKPAAVFGGGAAQKSANATVTTANDSNTTHSIKATVAAVKGAMGYAWFWGASGSEVLGAITTINSVLITATATGTQTAASLPAADWSQNNLVFDGLIYQALKTGSNAYYAAQRRAPLAPARRSPPTRQAASSRSMRRSKSAGTITGCRPTRSG
jgi:hypothetical protein